MSLEPDLQCKKTVLKNVKYERREGNNQSKYDYWRMYMFMGYDELVNEVYGRYWW